MDYHDGGIILKAQYRVCRGGGRRVSAERNGVGGELRYGRSLSGIPGTPPVANGFPLSPLRFGQGVVRARSVRAYRVWAPDFGHRGNDLSGTRIPLPVWPSIL